MELMRVREWWRYYVIFPRAVVFIWGLIVVHSWTEYAVVALLITQLSEMMPLPKAASVVNVLDGMTAVLMVVNVYFSETFLGPFLDVFCTTVAYISGLLLFYLGPESLKRVETQLVYATVILIGLGRAGRDVQLKEFLTDQCMTEKADEDEERVESRRKIWWRSAYILGIIASAYLFTKASWRTLCKMSTIAMGVAFVLFLLGFAFYECKKPAKATLHNMLRVLYVAITRRLYRHPLEYLRVNIRTLGVFNRWLDATAIQEQTTQGHSPRYEMDDWTRFEKELKSFLTMLPLWSTFLVYGLLLATANTFFYQQTDYTANYLGKIPVFSDQQQPDYSCNDPRLKISNKVPAIIFVIIRYSTSFLVSRVCDFLLRSRWGENVPRIVLLVRSGVGLAVSPICCFVAWNIEEYRVDQRMHHYVCIRFPWLFPQFILIGLMEGLVVGGMQSIFVSVVPHTLQRYGPTFTQFALNIGHFVSLPFVFIFRGLFADDLDLSKLGVYYKNLGFVCSANLVIYLCVAMYYRTQKLSGAEEDIEQPLEQIHSLEEQGLA